MSILRVEGVRRGYGGRPVVDVDSLDVARGEILAILGPNGAGKSTLFRLILLVEPVDAGAILLDGRPVRPGDATARRRLAGVFQRPYLFAGTVAENVGYALAARRLPRRERSGRVAELLEMMALTALADRPVHMLSGGEAQRVALARALAARPELLLLDEPTANLDVTVRRRFREELERLIRSQTGAAVLITHDPADAFALADRIAVMENGRIVQVGAPDDVVLRPATPFVAAFTGAELLLDGVIVDDDGGLQTVTLGGAGGRLLVAAPEDGAIPAGTPVHVAYRPEDLVLSLPGAPTETSARNRVPVRVAAVIPAGGLVRVRLEGDVSLTALVTRRSADTLGLAPGREVIAQLKAVAARVFRAG